MIDVGAVNKVMSIQNSSLIRAYQLEELSGSALDRASLRRSATVSGATQNGDRTPYGAPCYTFDSINDAVNCDANASDLDDWNAGTIIVLANTNTVTGSIDDIVHLQSVTADNEIEIRIIDDDLQFLMEINNASEASYNSAVISADTWFTAALSWQDASGDGDIFYYKDGSQIDTDSTAATMSTESWNQFIIGANRVPNAQYWSGSIGPVFCWSTRLTASEIALADRILRSL